MAPKNTPTSKGGAKKAQDGTINVNRGQQTKGVTPRYQKRYHEEVLPKLKELHPKKNVMEMPRLKKIVVNTCRGEATQNIKALDAALAELELITGQKAVKTLAKKSVATFKLREGMPIGAMVTLRREKMYEFYDKFVSVAAPRIRDFRGLSLNGFDGNGNYSVGIKEQMIFSEIEVDKIDSTRGLSISIVTSAKTDEEAREFLTLMGMPFRKS